MRFSQLSSSSLAASNYSNCKLFPSISITRDVIAARCAKLRCRACPMMMSEQPRHFFLSGGLDEYRHADRRRPSGGDHTSDGMGDGRLRSLMAAKVITAHSTQYCSAPVGLVRAMGPLTCNNAFPSVQANSLWLASRPTRHPRGIDPTVIGG
jgi:hypothetical protein